MKVYFDNAATTMLSREVLDEMMPYLTEHYGNASSTHSFGRIAKAALEQSRKTIAQHLGCKPGEIFFTSCGTEANNTAIKCAVRDLGITRIISSTIEHHCVLHTVEEMNKFEHVKVDYVNILSNGSFDLDHLASLLAGSKEKTLVTLMHANNETGNLNDLEIMAGLCEKNGAYLHSDTVQTIAHLPFNLKDSPVHFVSGSAHKFHGPKGIGFLYIKQNAKISSFIHGGSQERNMRAGTENIAGIVGMAKALDIAYAHLEEDRKKIESLKHYFAKSIRQQIEDIKFNTSLENSIFTVLNVSLPPAFSNEMTLFNLDIKGIACSGGSACSSGSNKGSHVMQAMNHPAERKAVRFSFSKYNTPEEVDYAIEKVKELALISV
jgi:cysteine desulfurase